MKTLSNYNQMQRNRFLYSTRSVSLVYLQCVNLFALSSPQMSTQKLDVVVAWLHLLQSHPPRRSDET